MSQSFFTYASGNKYLNLAFTLARSYLFHNKEEKDFYIISNCYFELPIDLKLKINKKIISKELAGYGLEFKLNLNLIAPTEESIFIDADSVIYGSIDFLFQEFNKKKSSLNVIGTLVNEGEWVDEHIPTLMSEFQLSYVIRYCGAFYYLKKGKLIDEIFSFAHELYSARKFQKHKHYINEEPLLAISMSKYAVEPIVDNGNIWSDLGQYQSGSSLSVFKGSAFQNLPGFKYKFWLPTGIYSPLILHMGSSVYFKDPWLFEYFRLKFWLLFKLSPNSIEFIISFFIKPIYKLLKFLRQLIGLKR